MYSGPRRFFRPVFFFGCGPVRTLTDSLQAWAAMLPSRAGCFCFFLLRPRSDAHSLTYFGRGDPPAGRARVVFFFCCGRARTLMGWGDFGKVRVVFFFWLWPRPVFFG